MIERPIELERLTWPEVEEALSEGYTTVIVPCGAVEQHGPHLPLFMDAEHGTFLARAVAERMGRTLIAPTVRVGCSEHHMAFPGTLTLERATFLAVCRDLCRSLSRHGFTHVCLLPTHGGNFEPLAEGLPDFRRVAGEGCLVSAFTDFMGLLRTWKAAVGAAGGSPEAVGGHADVAESSLMLIMHPALVRQDRAVAGYSPSGSEEEFKRIITEGFRSVTPTGVLGDARGMSEEIGRRCLAELADLVATDFRSRTAPA